MRWFNELEKRFGKYAIPNLIRYFTILFAIGFAIIVAKPDIYFELLALDMSSVFKGQVWRLVTWLIYPPSSSLVFGILMLVLYFNLGNTLEYVWGKFKFNMFMLGGVFFHIIAALLLYIIFPGQIFILTPANLIMSIFLAFAITFPEMEFLLYFVLPIKAKILAVFYVVMEIFNFISGSNSDRITIVLSFMNVIIFYILTKNLGRYTPSNIARRAKFNNAVKIKPVSKTQHICAVCKRTEKDVEDLEFRFCTKCNGDYEYCSEHLYTHKHIE